MEKVIIAALIVPAVIIIGYIASFAAGLIVAPLVMWAWNGSVLVTVFGLPVIGYWESFWTYILATLLVKSYLTPQTNQKG